MSLCEATTRRFAQALWSLRMLAFELGYRRDGVSATLGPDALASPTAGLRSARSLARDAGVIRRKFLTDRPLGVGSQDGSRNQPYHGWVLVWKRQVQH